MEKGTRNALLASLLQQLESACDTLRAIIADELEIGQTLPPAQLQEPLSTGCVHPENRRRDITTLGATVKREMCRECATILENGRPVAADAATAGGVS